MIDLSKLFYIVIKSVQTKSETTPLGRAIRLGDGYPPGRWLFPWAMAIPQDAMLAMDDGEDATNLLIRLRQTLSPHFNLRKLF